MTHDAVIIGAGLGGLTAAAILARAGRKVLVIERSNSVGGAASSYKVGDLFVEGSLHETSNPRDPRDPKHNVLKRAGVLDAVTWAPAGTLYEVRGGPLATPLTLPDNLDGAKASLTARFPDAGNGIAAVLDEMSAMAAGPVSASGNATLVSRLTKAFGDNEALKCAIAANLWYSHDDPATLWWPLFSAMQGALLSNGARFIQGGSQRLSSALARAARAAGGQVLVRRIATRIEMTADDARITHAAKDGGDPQTVETRHVIGGASLEAMAELLSLADAAKLRQHGAGRQPSISLFALTLGLSKPPRTFGVSSYSTQLLPPWMTRLDQYAEGTALMAQEPGERMPPLSLADYAAIDAAIPAPPFVLSVIGPDRLSNWNSDDMDTYREKRARWQDAIVRYLDTIYPGLADAVVASSFNTALSVRQYLNAPTGVVYGYAPLQPAPGMSLPTPRTAIPRLFLSSSYGGVGGYTGAISAGGACADMILGEAK
ncbi:MAG: FAD-dependent oxidoreductase [Proteobacteria bacterium SG_bin9]|nr:MAG: FAD-dependent oxidoreductase [Proteobacteria bacterium SG_bin9]